jgi:hypothetical protein
MPRTYRASLTLDYSNSGTNEYQYLISALIQSGWTYVETSSLVLETENREEIWQGIQLVMKQDSSLTPSAVTLHIVGSDDIEKGVAYPYADQHPNAWENVRNKPLPGNVQRDAHP